ncbi:MAG: hypothetical protein GEU78_16565 [Actinobacteria bacterium]|nr:hypothetical protein [Actinomycetota bacterium]
MSGPPGYLFSDQVTIIHPSTSTDEYGNDQLDYGATATEEISSARLEPSILSGGSSEMERDRRTLIGAWNLYLPTSASIDGHDRIRHGDNMFDVVGPPALMKTPRGPHHWYATLRHISG